MVEAEGILENLAYVEFVSEKWLTVVRYPELRKVVGNMDPIADIISSINNAQAVGKKQVVFYPYSNFKYAILDLLKNEGLIDNVEKRGRLSKRKIVVDLKYNEDGSPKITKIRKISKQGQRIYSTYREMKPVKSGHGFSIVSTSKGLLTNKEARKNKIGGEIICEVW